MEIIFATVVGVVLDLDESCFTPISALDLIPYFRGSFYALASQTVAYNAAAAVDLYNISVLLTVLLGSTVLSCGIH